MQTVLQSILSKITSIRVSDVLTRLQSSNFQIQRKSIDFQVFSSLSTTVLSSVVSLVMSICQVFVHLYSSSGPPHALWHWGGKTFQKGSILRPFEGT